MISKDFEQDWRNLTTLELFELIQTDIVGELNDNLDDVVNDSSVDLEKKMLTLHITEPLTEEQLEDYVESLLPVEYDWEVLTDGKIITIQLIRKLDKWEVGVEDFDGDYIEQYRYEQTARINNVVEAVNELVDLYETHPYGKAIKDELRVQFIAGLKQFAEQLKQY